MGVMRNPIGDLIGGLIGDLTRNLIARQKESVIKCLSEGSIEKRLEVDLFTNSFIITIMKMKCNFKMKESGTSLENLLKREGKKNSTKRNLIINSFLLDDRHYSVEELHQRVKELNPKISLSTVYRTLKLLTAWGLAYERRFDEKNIRFEPAHQAEHHDHLVCLKCGEIFEFKDPRIEKLQERVAKRYRFVVLRHKLELYGYCRRCQR